MPSTVGQILSDSFPIPFYMNDTLCPLSSPLPPFSCAPRCTVAVQRGAPAPPLPPRARRASALCWMAVGAVECVPGSLTRTAARANPVITSKASTAT